MAQRTKGDVQIVVEPVETRSAAITAALRRSRVVKTELGVVKGDRLTVETDILGRDPEKSDTFEARVHHHRSGRSISLRGNVADPAGADVRPSRFEPNPTPEELHAAHAFLAADKRFAKTLKAAHVTVYQPMPPLASVVNDDGTVTRRIALGIHELGGSPAHRMVAVDLANGAVEADPESHIGDADHDCEAHLPEPVTSAGVPAGIGTVRVKVMKDGEELWNLLVTRPRDSRPTRYGKGSGVELSQVRFKGKLVLHQAHVPILNVLYDNGITYRDWQNSETPFHAVGSEPVGAGWRLCTEAPATILEAGTDAGNGFVGVALHYEDGELRIVSELQAGWYRYVSDWRLHDCGRIDPRFGFAGTRNPMTCEVHEHHVYWRLDFDIDGAGHNIVDTRRPGIIRDWTPMIQENSQLRAPLQTYRVSNMTTGRGYQIIPGVADGTADDFGDSDMWFLRYHADEVDDHVTVVGGSPADTRVRLDPYVNGEAIADTDVVVWYAGHFRHDEHDQHAHVGHIVGPELRPHNWR